MNKKIKCAFIAAALASVVTLSALSSACTIKTDHPQAKITVSFNDVTYNIEYKLYRNMYPQTVQHFIELADAGFYNDMIVHDYKSGNDWFTGAYSYTDEDASLYTSSNFSEYLENHYKEEEYYKLYNDGKLTPSVYSKQSYDKNNNIKVDDEYQLATLIGEFSSNQHKIDKGALSAKLGCLKMFYYDKGTSNKQVVINKVSTGQILKADYKYNCATSVFSMQVGGSTSYTSSNYCVFAELKDDGAGDELDKLVEAIDVYVSGVGSSNFVKTGNKTMVDTLDEFAADGGVEVSFSMTTKPIIIKSVKITKY